MTVYQETGNRLPLISLGGIQSNRGWGRNMETQVFTGLGLGDGDATLILVDNPRRIAAIIYNGGGGQLAIKAVGNSWNLVIQPFGTFQIDQNFPFTGAIEAWTDVAAIATVMEISI